MVFKNKLQYRIILLVFGILLVVGIAGGVVTLYLQRQATASYFSESTTVLATVLRESLERDMLLADRGHIQESVALMASKSSVKDVTIISNDRRIYASSETSVIGKIKDDEEIIQVFASG